MSNVVVSVGKSMEASILIALHLKELGAPKTWVKAISEDHEIVLKKLGVKEVVFPVDFVPKADRALQAEDVLLILGDEEKLSQILAQYHRGDDQLGAFIEYKGLVFPDQRARSGYSAMFEPA